MRSRVLTHAIDVQSILHAPAYAPNTVAALRRPGLPSAGSVRLYDSLTPRSNGIVTSSTVTTSICMDALGAPVAGSVIDALPAGPLGNISAAVRANAADKSDDGVVA